MAEINAKAAAETYAVLFVAQQLYGIRTVAQKAAGAIRPMFAPGGKYEHADLVGCMAGALGTFAMDGDTGCLFDYAISEEFGMNGTAGPVPFSVLPEDFAAYLDAKRESSEAADRHLRVLAARYGFEMAN